MDTVDRNVIITFDSQLTDKFIELSGTISQNVASTIKLNKKDQFPHLTLYMTKYPKRNIEKVLTKLQEIANTTKPFMMIFNSKSCHSSGTIFIDPQRSAELLDLHSILVDELNLLREGLYNEDELSLPGRGEKARHSLINFGMWAVKENYQAHVSIGRVADPKNDGFLALNALPKTINFQTLVDSVSLVERGPNGTCKKIIEKFNFQS